MFDGSQPICPPLVQVMFAIAIMLLCYPDDMVFAVALGFLWMSSHLWSIERFMRRQASLGGR